jgi:PKD repeat protein
LDVLAELYRSDGVKIATSNPIGSLGASLNLSVSSGTYYLFVRGTGQGDPSTGYSSYASLGAYAVNGLVVSSSDPIPPVAGIAATPSSGDTPLSVQFNASQSYDPDGTIVSYSWSFGDGTTGAGSMPVHTYSIAGSYTATVTVTDNSGLTANASMTISVTQPDLASVMHVGSITVTTSSSGGWNTATAVVTILNGSANPVAGATVTGNWSGAVSGTSSGTTDSTGKVTLVSKRYKKANDVTFTVTNVSKAGMTYDPAKNAVSKASGR